MGWLLLFVPFCRWGLRISLVKYLAPGSQLVRGEQGQELDPKPRAHAYTPLLLRMRVCLAFQWHQVELVGGTGLMMLVGLVLKSRLLSTCDSNTVTPQPSNTACTTKRQLSLCCIFKSLKYFILSRLLTLGSCTLVLKSSSGLSPSRAWLSDLRWLSRSWTRFSAFSPFSSSQPGGQRSVSSASGSIYLKSSQLSRHLRMTSLTLCHG